MPTHPAGTFTASIDAAESRLDATADRVPPWQYTAIGPVARQRARARAASSPSGMWWASR